MNLEAANDQFATACVAILESASEGPDSPVTIRQLGEVVTALGAVLGALSANADAVTVDVREMSEAWRDFMKELGLSRE